MLVMVYLQPSEILLAIPLVVGIRGSDNFLTYLNMTGYPGGGGAGGGGGHSHSHQTVPLTTKGTPSPPAGPYCQVSPGTG